AGKGCLEVEKEFCWKSWDETSFVKDRTVRSERGRWQCQFLVGIEAKNDFGVVGRLLGRGGANMKRIAGDTNAKMRLRGRGSGFKEADLDGKESTDPLMLCVSAPSEKSYREASVEIHKLLTDMVAASRKHMNHEWQNYNQPFLPASHVLLCPAV
ncbi:unnamed protein product, partial [Durusdinium trenchii]